VSQLDALLDAAYARQQAPRGDDVRVVLTTQLPGATSANQWGVPWETTLKSFYANRRYLLGKPELVAGEDDDARQLKLLEVVKNQVAIMLTASTAESVELACKLSVRYSVTGREREILTLLWHSVKMMSVSTASPSRSKWLAQRDSHSIKRPSDVRAVPDSLVLTTDGRVLLVIAALVVKHSQAADSPTLPASALLLTMPVPVAGVGPVAAQNGGGGAPVAQPHVDEPSFEVQQEHARSSLFDLQIDPSADFEWTDARNVSRLSSRWIFPEAASNTPAYLRCLSLVSEPSAAGPKSWLRRLPKWPLIPVQRPQDLPTR
jgi:hypothetical protein